MVSFSYLLREEDIKRVSFMFVYMYMKTSSNIYFFGQVNFNEPPYHPLYYLRWAFKVNPCESAAADFKAIPKGASKSLFNSE